MPAKLVTFDVSKLDKSNDSKLLQLLNIPLILVTLLVSKLDRSISSNAVKF